MDNQTPKILNLQIDRPCFKAILSGEQKVEHRFVYPNNAKRYVIQKEVTDDDGNIIMDVQPIHYDALRLRNGRRTDAPVMTVEILKAEFIVLTDDEGRDIVYEQSGKFYYCCQVWYTLGNILSAENLEHLDDVKIKENNIISNI